MAKILGFDRIVQIYIAAITTYGIYLAASSPTSQTIHNATGAAVMPVNHWAVPITLIAGGIALSVVNYVVKRWNRSKIESPLFRRANGALDWKPIQYEQIANKAFVNAEINLDGIRYIDCTFEHCTFFYEGSAPGEIVGDKSGLIRRNPNEVNFALRSGNPIVIAAWQLQYKVIQGGPGVKEMRFEPKN